MPFANDCLDTVGVCPNRLWVLSVTGGAEALQRVQLIDPLTGALIDLTQYDIYGESSSSSGSSTPGTPSGVEIVMKARYEDVRPFATMQAVIKSADDAVNGLIYVPFKSRDTCRAGIYVATATIRTEGIVKKAIPFYIEVTMDLSVYNPTGPISIAEIRLATRDVCPAFNFLIDTVEFKDEEIAWALRRPIDYWNEAQPPLNVIYSPTTFPFRYNWTEATISILLKTVAIWLRRNDLDYSAGGLTVADTKKWPDYQKMADERWAEYKEWVKNKKMELNISDGFSSLGGYRWNPYR
jgi:hypothetical protein